MKYPISISRNGRREFLRQSLLAVAGLSAVGASVTTANAAFGPGKVPTDFILSVTPGSARVSQSIAVVGQLRRLDGKTAGLAGIPVQFWTGSATYPSVMLGRYFTDGKGSIRFSFAAKTLNSTGNFVLLADVNPVSANETWIAAPRPYATFSVRK